MFEIRIFPSYLRKKFPSLSLVLALALCQIFPVHAQVLQQWVRTYDSGGGLGNRTDIATSIAVDASGNVYVTGRSQYIGTSFDFLTIKYNSAGDSLWVRRHNGPGDSADGANSLALDLSGNVYVTGWSMGSGPGYDYETIKYNSSGNLQWDVRYNGPGNGDDAAYFTAVDGSGNVYITGWSTGGGTGYDYATIKYNSSGVQQWVSRYNGTGNGHDGAYSLAIDGSGNTYVTGYSIGSGTSYDYATIKYNSLGVQQWVSRYNGPGNLDDIAYSIKVDGSGNVYITGQSPGSGTNYDFATIKYNSLGSQQWASRYNGPGNGEDVANSLAVDASGNVYVTGRSFGGAGIGDDYATIKYNTSGGQQWVSRYNGPSSGADAAYSLALDASGNAYVTGYSAGNNTGNDYATVKYSASGVQQWLARYSGIAYDDDARSIVLDGLGNVYVTGISLLHFWDYQTIKYSQVVGIEPISGEVPNQFGLSQNYPNPFNPGTKIRFDIPSNRTLSEGKRLDVKLTIYDILGREVTTLINESLKPGTYEAEWDAANYPSGIYLYRLTSADFSAAMIMELLK